MGIFGGKIGKGLVRSPMNSFLLLGVLRTVCASFGENRSRNATVRVRTDGYTEHRYADRRKPVL